MTKPRTPEEIAEEWFKIHDGMCVRSIDGQPYREHFLAALREAADTPSRQIADEARHEEREALREKLKNSRPPVEQAGSMTPFESGWRNACASNIHWLDARSCSEETRPRKLSNAPCDRCGYNGPGYFQPEQHPCATEHHQAVALEVALLRRGAEARRAE